jgi:hypothetical protein
LRIFWFCGKQLLEPGEDADHSGLPKKVAVLLSFWLWDGRLIRDEQPRGVYLKTGNQLPFAHQLLHRNWIILNKI